MVMKKIILIIAAVLMLTACNSTENGGVDINITGNIGADQSISDTTSEDTDDFGTDSAAETIPDTLKEKDDKTTESEQEGADTPKESMNDSSSTESSENIGTKNEVTSETNTVTSESNAATSEPNAVISENEENKSDTESNDKPPYELNGQITMMLTDVTEQSPEKENDIFAPQFMIVNGMEYDYWYGLGFTLERLTDDENWETVEQLEPMSVIEIAVMVASGESNIFDAPISPAYGELEAGKYRVVLNVSCEVGTETLYGEFEVK